MHFRNPKKFSKMDRQTRMKIDRHTMWQETVKPLKSGIQKEI